MGQSLVDNHEGVRMKDHQGKEVRDERFPESWLAAKPMSHSHWVTLVFVNKVCAERTVSLASLVGFLGFVVVPISLPCSAAVLLLKVDLISVSISFPEANRCCTITR